MKSTKYIAEITTQKNEKHLSEGWNPPACSPAPFVSTKKFSVWVYRKVFCHFWPIKLGDLSHEVSATPIFLGIFFYHSFYGMTSRFKGGGTFLCLALSLNDQQKQFFSIES